MYLLSKVHRHLVSLPGFPVISNCGTSAEKGSKFIDHHLQPILRSVMYTKNSNDFLSKLKNLKKIPDSDIWVTADVAELHSSIAYNEGLEVLMKQLDNFYRKSIHTEDVVKMAEFVLKINYFELNSNVKHRINGTARVNYSESSTNLYCKTKCFLRKVILFLILESLRNDSMKNAIQRIWSRKQKGHLECPSLRHSKTSGRSVSGNGGPGVPIMVNYNPILCRLEQVIRKNLCFLYQDEEVKQVSKPVPFVSFRSVRTLMSDLVRVEFYSVGES